MANSNYVATTFAVILLIAQIGAGDDDEGSLILEGKKKLIVGVPKKCSSTDFFVDLKLDPANKSQVENAQGYSIEVFNATISYLQNISVEYLAFSNEDGSCVENYDALLEQLYKRKYGAVVGDVTILANRSNYVDFTLPYTQSDMKMLVKFRHDPRLDMWIFVRPFTWDLWLSIAIICVFIGGIILFMERNVKQDSKKQLNGASILWLPVVQAVLPEKESPAKNCSKFVLVLWLILAFVLMQSYTACLSSILTVHQLQPRYLSEYDVINDPHIHIGYHGSLLIRGLLLERLKVEKSRVKNYSTVEQYKEALDKGSSKGGVDAIFYEVPYIKVFLKKYGSKYAVIETKHRTGGFGFAFPKGSTLTSRFSSAILNVRESSKMDDIERKYFGSSNNDENESISNSTLDDDTNQTSLTTYSFAGLFLLIGIFSLSAVIVSESRIWQKPIKAKMCIQRFLSRSFTRTNPLEESSITGRNIDKEDSGIKENTSLDNRDDDRGKLSMTSLTCVETKTMPV